MTRARTFFITINQTAQCFSELTTCLPNICKQTDFFAYVMHDKDVTEQGELKKPHFHLVLKFENARTFESIQKKLLGAHIETSNNFTAICQYLIHLNDTTKHQYAQEEVITNNIDLLNHELSKKNYEKFDPNELYRYAQEGYDTKLKLFKRFGAQIQGYLNLINQLLLDIYREIQENKIYDDNGHEIKEEDLPF